MKPNSKIHTSVSANKYETDQVVAQYINFHYGPEYLNVPNFSKTLAKIAAELCPVNTRALDIGCAVGRASFELANYFKHIDAIDSSSRFIDVTSQLVKHHVVDYTLPIEGEVLDHRQAQLSRFDIGAEQIARVKFSKGDAMDLKPEYNAYDLILAANLLDHLREPELFLKIIHQRMKPGAILMLTCPYTWHEASTLKENWLGGMYQNGEALMSYQSLRRILLVNFDEAIPPRDIPFVICETARKYEYVIAQLTAWTLRN